MSIQAQNTELNIVPGGIIPVVHVSQYDVDRVLTFNLYDRNSEASLASGTTAVIEGTKPDGNGFQYAATISGNTVTVNTTIQMTVLSGTVDCKIVLRNGSQVIGTALFIMDVEKAGINENTPMSETDLPLIIAEATEQMERAEAEALKAEGYATGKQSGEEVSSESPYYHNNAEYYSEYAESIAESLPDGLNIKGTCTFAELPSIADSFVGDTWVISDSFTTTSDFRGGSGVSVAASAYVYLTDSNKWDILPSKSGGHTIVNSSGTELPQRSKLQFEGAIVSDDETNNATVVETVNPVDYEEDIYGVETPNSQSIQHQLTDQTNVLGAKNLIPYPYKDGDAKTKNGITFSCDTNGVITANGTASALADYALTNSATAATMVQLQNGCSYTLSGCPVGGGFDTYKNRIKVYQDDISTTYITKDDFGDGVTFSIPNDNNKYYGHCYIHILGGQTVNNLTFKPMLRLASDPDNTYVPYAMTNRELTEVTTETLTISDSTVTGSFTVSKVGKVVTITAWSVQGTTVKQGATISASIPLPANYVATPLICANSQGAIGGFLYIDNTNKLNLHVYIANTKMYGALTYVCK